MKIAKNFSINFLNKKNMKVKKGKLYFFLSILVSFYLVFRTIFFVFLGNSSVDVLIGFSIFFLFFLIYKKSRKFIYNYLWDLTKNLYLNFFTLFKLLISFNKLIINYNTIYLDYFRYSVFSLKIVSNNMSIIFNKLNMDLSKKFLINLFINKLNSKKFFINSRVVNLCIEHNKIITNFELNILLSFDFIFFI